MAACGDAPLRNSSRTRSLINTLESIAMPRANATAAMPGKVSVACSMDNTATSSNRLKPRAILEKAPNNA